MPRQRLPIQYFADILGELQGINRRLDQLISQQAPADVSEPAGDEPEKVRLEEPVRSGDVQPGEVETKLHTGGLVLSRDQVHQAAAEIDADFPDSGRAENAPEGTCQQQTKRGNVCGKPLPCRYHP